MEAQKLVPPETMPSPRLPQVSSRERPVTADQRNLVRVDFESTLDLAARRPPALIIPIVPLHFNHDPNLFCVPNFTCPRAPAVLAVPSLSLLQCERVPTMLQHFTRRLPQIESPSSSPSPITTITAAS
jgi:hypothetical protein